MAVQNTSLAALLLRIENSLPNLSKSERKVAEYIRGNPRGIIDLSVAALAAGYTARISGAQAVAKSWPGFFAVLQQLGAGIEVEKE